MFCLEPMTEQSATHATAMLDMNDPFIMVQYIYNSIIQTSLLPNPELALNNEEWLLKARLNYIE